MAIHAYYTWQVHQFSNGSSGVTSGDGNPMPGRRFISVDSIVQVKERDNVRVSLRHRPKVECEGHKENLSGYCALP